MLSLQTKSAYEANTEVARDAMKKRSLSTTSCGRLMLAPSPLVSRKTLEIGCLIDGKKLVTAAEVV